MCLSHTAANLGQFREVRAFSKCAPADNGLFAAMAAARVRTTLWSSRGTTSCRNEYPSENPDDRRQHMASLGDPFTAADIAAMPQQDVLRK